MIFLSVESSSKYLSVALGDQTRLLAGARRLYEKGKSDGLALLMEACFKKAKVPLSKVDVFGVGVGPGSFTGLRIGISAIKGLSYALKKPCVGFSSLEAIATNFSCAAGSPKTLAVAVDARRSNVYGRFYALCPGVVARGREGLYPLEDFFAKVPAGLLVAGDILSTAKKDVNRLARGHKEAKEDLWYPTPESIALLTRRECAERRFVDAFRLEAVYYYQQDCQVKSDSKSRIGR